MGFPLVWVISPRKEKHVKKRPKFPKYLKFLSQMITPIMKSVQLYLKCNKTQLVLMWKDIK